MNEWVSEQCKVSTPSELKLDYRSGLQSSNIFTRQLREGKECWEAIGSYV